MQSITTTSYYYFLFDKLNWNQLNWLTCLQNILSNPNKWFINTSCDFSFKKETKKKILLNWEKYKENKDQIGGVCCSTSKFNGSSTNKGESPTWSISREVCFCCVTIMKMNDSVFKTYKRNMCVWLLLLLTNKHTLAYVNEDFILTILLPMCSVFVLH